MKKSPTNAGFLIAVFYGALFTEANPWFHGLPRVSRKGDLPSKLKQTVKMCENTMY